MFGKAFVALAVAAASAAAQALTINTPASLVQCQPALITWSGGSSPYILAVIPGEQTSAAAISTLSSSLTSSPYTWNVNLPSGSYITLKITDSVGNVQYSSAVTIQAGSSNSCLNASASTSGLATTGAVTTTGSGSATLSGSAASASAPSGSTVSISRSGSSVSTAAPSSAAASSASTSRSSAAASSGGAGASTSSAAAAATSSTGAGLANAVVGVPAVAAGLLGGLAFLL